MFTLKLYHLFIFWISFHAVAANISAKLIQNSISIGVIPFYGFFAFLSFCHPFFLSFPLFLLLSFCHFIILSSARFLRLWYIMVLQNAAINHNVHWIVQSSLCVHFDNPSLRSLAISKKNIRKQEAGLCKYDYITLFCVRRSSLKGTWGSACLLTRNNFALQILFLIFKINWQV